ncbi:MAG: ATP-binding response regulator [Acidobacteriaceae bacterium]
MAQAPKSNSKGRILVIDDKEATRYIFRRILGRAGYTVEEASTGEEGLAKVADSPDLVIADVNLPDMLGYDLCRRIKANALSSSIPVLQISASFISDESKVQALEGGADSYLIQPVEPTVLIAQVQALLRLRRAEALSHFSARQWQATFDALSDGLALADSNGDVVRANRAFLRHLNLKTSQVEGAPLSKVFQLAFGIPITGLSAGNAPGTVKELSASNGWFRVHYDQLPADPSGTSGSILFVADITDQKKLQEAMRMSERLAATGRLAHTIAHEINNPLEALSNLLYLVQQQEDLSKEARAYLQQGSIELDRISQITKQILAYHRDSKRPVAATAKEMIDSVLTIFRASIIGNHVDLSKRITSSRLINVQPGEMRQAFGNLIANALDAMGTSGGRLIVHCRDATEPRSGRKGVRIVISDSGSGISASAHKHIFDAFYTTKDLKGSGIGLWLTSEVIGRHNGHIRLRSRTEGPHRGTIFDIFLPEYTSNEDAAACAPS